MEEKLWDKRRGSSWIDSRWEFNFWCFCWRVGGSRSWERFWEGVSKEGICHTGACSQRPGVHGMSWQQTNPGRAMIFRIEDNSKITTVARSEQRRASKISGNDSRRTTTGSRRVRTSSKGTRTTRGWTQVYSLNEGKGKDDEMLRMIIPGEKDSRFEDDSENLK